MESTTSTVIVTTITDVLLRMNLSISNCRGQCYDGASSMSGSRSGVAIQLSQLEPKALYTHCYGHSLNLAIQDTLKGLKIMRDTLDTVYEITKLIKKSPKREAIFKKIQDDVKSWFFWHTHVVPHLLDSASRSFVINNRKLWST